MKNLKHLILTALISVFAVGTALAQTSSDGNEKVVKFTFVAGDNMFYLQVDNNRETLNNLFAIVEQYRSEILSGKMPVYVDGYSASLPTVRENLNIAFVRANRVKSELIMQKGLMEEHFRTRNFATALDGQKDIVVVTLRIPAEAMPEPTPEPVVVEPVITVECGEGDETCCHKPEPEPIVEVIEEPVVLPVSEKVAKPYCIAFRTNLLYDAVLFPTLGIEWRVSDRFGIKVDGSISYWGAGNATDKVQRMWMLSPELRYYMLNNRRLYVSAMGNYGHAHIFNYPMSNLISKDTGYIGDFWNVGVAIGYQLYLSRSFSLDFNLGLGYSSFIYDTFEVVNGARRTTGRDIEKTMWGPAQAGISLVWTIGGTK